MIEADCVDGVEMRQVILLRAIVAMPAHYVEWGMICFGLPEIAGKFIEQNEFAVR